MKQQCKKTVHAGPQRLVKYRCQRNATKDGFCWQHHPEAEKKRQEHSEKKLAATPFTMFIKH